MTVHLFIPNGLKVLKKRVLPPTYLFTFIILMVLLHFLLPVKEVIPGAWKFLGGVPLLLGTIFNLMADKAFKNNHTTVKPFEVSTTLITTGVFRFTRNPMYLGMVLILAGIATLIGTLSPYAVIPVFIVVIDMVFIKPEERMLAETFGEVWTEYQLKVRRWL